MGKKKLIHSNCFSLLLTIYEMRVYSHHVLMNTDTSDFFTLTYYYTYALPTYADNSRSRHSRPSQIYHWSYSLRTHSYRKRYPQERYSRFIPALGQGWSSLPLETQQLWPPNQQAHDPDSWTDPHLLQLKMEYEVLVNNYGCKVQEMYMLQDHPPPPSEFLLLPSLGSLYKVYVRNQELPQSADSRPVMRMLHLLVFQTQQII